MAKKKPTRGQLRNRAQRQAENANAQDQATINANKRSARRTYRTELGAAKGAKRANKKLLKTAAANIPGRIHGLALQQIQTDLAGRMQDAQGMVKYEKAGLKQDLRTALQDARQQQAALDANIAADAQSILHDSIARQREKQQADLKKRTEYDRQIKAALAEIRQSVAKTRGPGGVALKVEAAALRADSSLRRNLVDYLTTSQGISVPAAKKAVSLFTRGKNTTLDKVGMQVAGVTSAAAQATSRPGFTDSIVGLIDRNQPWWEDETP